MTNFEYIRSLSADELAKWLHKYINFDSSPAESWFNKNCCSKCESIMCKYKDSDREFPAAYCELENKCKFYPDLGNLSCLEVVELWLNAEVENG